VISTLYGPILRAPARAHTHTHTPTANFMISRIFRNKTLIYLKIHLWFIYACVT